MLKTSMYISQILAFAFITASLNVNKWGAAALFDAENDISCHRVSSSDASCLCMSPRNYWHFPDANFPPAALLPSCCSDKSSAISSKNRDSFLTPCYPISPSTPLAGSEGELRYSGPGSGMAPADLRAALSGRQVDIIGDTLLRQWFESLMCYLSIPWEGWSKTSPNKELQAFLTSSLGYNISEFKFKSGHIGFTEVSLLANSSSNGIGHNASSGTIGSSNGHIAYFYYAPFLHSSKDEQEANTGSVSSSSSSPSSSSSSSLSGSQVVEKVMMFMSNRSHFDPNRTFIIGASRYVASWKIAAACRKIRVQCIFVEQFPTVDEAESRSMADHGITSSSADSSSSTSSTNNQVCERTTLSEEANHRCDRRLYNAALWNYTRGFLKLPVFDAYITRGGARLGTLLSDNDNASQQYNCFRMFSDTSIWEPMHVGFTSALKNVQLYSSFAAYNHIDEANVESSSSSISNSNSNSSSGFLNNSTAFGFGENAMPATKGSNSNSTSSSPTPNPEEDTISSGSSSSSNINNTPNAVMCNVSRGDHVNGSWVYVSEAQKHLEKNFICCTKNEPHPVNDEGYEFCHQDPSPYYYLQHHGYAAQNVPDFSGGCGCDKNESHDLSATVTPRERYQWQPDSCSLLEWNSTQFCELLGGRRLLLVGDSTMAQTATSLMNRLNNNTFVASGGAGPNASALGNCAGQIYFGLAHWLYMSGGEFTPWTVYVTQSKADIVILNAGAHFEDGGDAVDVFEHVYQAIEVYKKTKPQLKVAWKTQNPGHLDCIHADKPIKTAEVIREGDPRDKFHWFLFPQIDAMSKWYSERAGVPVIDMSPLYLRPDAHPSLNQLLLHKAADFDCLHFCSPGPVDLFGNLVLNMLYNGEL